MAFISFQSPKDVKEGKHIVSTPLTIQTSASIANIMQALDTHVVTAPDHSSLTAVIYIVSRTENQIIYACGYKLSATIFQAALTLSRNSDATTGVFEILRYYHNKGAISQLDLMRTLRNQVREAFASADSAAKFSE